ncbi:MAG: transglycosylase SLT domain-containing protein [Thiotrichales bacterium]|nr:transglycosylase SLT domain-containing protein [Thiotrichales bacterium]
MIRKTAAMRGLIALAIVCVTFPAERAAGAMCPEIADTARRAAFIKAERSPPRSRSAWERLRRDLGDYPLFPYVELARLRADRPHVATPAVEEFLRRYDGEPVTFRLQRQWLRKLAERREWGKFIEWYPGGSSADLKCHHARALLATGDEAGGLSAAEDLWMSGKSQPKACDPVFAVWLESDRFSPSLAWERIGLAMARGGVRLARYLERFLDSDSRRLAAAWRAVHKNPRRVTKVKLEGEPSKVEAILAHGLERMARRDPDGAVRALAALEGRVVLRDAARAKVARRIGLSFASRHDPRAIEWLWRVDAAHADVHMLRWRTAAAVLHSRWDEVIDGIASMTDEERGRERWRFWHARALEATGRADKARAELKSLARERDYYGFLAADRLETAYRFNHRPLEVASGTVERVAALPAMRRALEFLALDRRTEARREWHALIRSLGEEELKAASWIARCRGWHGRAILTIVRTRDQDDLELRFPVVHGDIVDSASRRRDLPPATVYAFIRQESAFMSDARSPAGALGLMQIMPRTGRMLMRSIGRKLRSRKQLLVPDLNVELGTRYIRSLLSKTGGNFVLAAASYNAGPHRVRGWLPEEAAVEADAWIDNIPFTETRRYVRRLLAYSAIYEHRLGRQPTRLIERMPPVPARTSL